MTPAIAPLVTPPLISVLRSHPHLPQHSWYLIAAAALTVLNRPDEIPKIYNYATGAEGQDNVARPGHEERLHISRRMREALIKSSAVAGVPKAINSLLSLKAATPTDMLDEPGGPSPTGRSTDLYEKPTAEVLERGQSFFDKIYGKISRRVMGQMDRSGTEDLGLTARLVYGHVLSNTKVLSAVETSFVLVAGLIPQDVNPQLKGHLRGALNGGATVEQIRAVREVTMMICQASGMQRLAENAAGGWGWREEVADV